jgi:hypothetical protein
MTIDRGQIGAVFGCGDDLQPVQRVHINRVFQILLSLSDTSDPKTRAVFHLVSIVAI